MEIVWALQEPPKAYRKSLFLAGPTPRDPSIPTWRTDALKLLREMGYDGVVFVPESPLQAWHGDVQAQIDWEERVMHMADVIVFWVPRSLNSMLGLTTNVEFGRWEDTGKIVLGYPESAPHVRYLQAYADRHKVSVTFTLGDTLSTAVKRLRDGALRQGGEREVPLHIWDTPSFQMWYAAHTAVGNRLDHARVQWTFMVGPNKDFVFLWALWVDVYIASEGRHKVNEFVLARPDISTIVMFQPARTLRDTLVVQVREFRSPVRNQGGFVWEAAGGSSFKPGLNPLVVASEEVHEETGLEIEWTRFVLHADRQMVATLSAHHAHCFYVALTDEEVTWLRGQEGVPHGVEGESERTYTEIRTLGEIMDDPTTDWSMLGMILSAVLSSPAH